MSGRAKDVWRESYPVLVIGPGAIGALVAGRLALAGHPVTVACRTEQTARTIRERGVIVTDPDGVRAHARVDCVVAPERQRGRGPWRLVVLATKVADAQEALARWVGVVDDRAPIVAMQNGLPDPGLGKLAGGRLVECVVAFPATLDGVGESTQTGPGTFIVGRAEGTSSSNGGRAPSAVPAAVVDARQVLDVVVPTTVSDNIIGAKWTKLLINACITSLGVVSGTDLGALMKRGDARALFLEVMREGVDAGQAEGVRFESVSGLQPTRLAGLVRLGPPGRAVQHGVLRVLGRKVARQRSSSLQSLARGRRTEVDALNGTIVSIAAQARCPAPVNGAILDTVHRIERGDMEPSMDHIVRLHDELLR